MSCRLSGTFTDAGLADQHRIVLGAAREHLDGAPDLLIAADHRIDLAVACGLGEVTGIFLQRVVGVLSRARVGRAALAQRVDRLVEALRRHAGAGQDLSGLAVLLERERKQQPLDRDVAVARLFRDFLRLIEYPRQRWRQIDLTGAAARHFGKLGERRLDGGKRFARSAARAVDQAARQALGVVEQDLEQVLGGKLLMALAQGQRLGGLNETAGAVGVFFEIHTSSLSSTPSAREASAPSLT